ncbi:MAG TPA: hypothetical protein VFB33_03495 [Candidatus Binataceae bacterium]|jgi:hypothetical protein|nr:hypothetical protein [Candidatus Binataceae bacterium]
MVVYLAPDAFDHLYRKVGCTAADIAALRAAIYGRAFSIPLSIHTLEEILLARKAAPQARAAQIRMLLSVSSPRTLLKPAEELLLDDVRSFATSGQPASPILRGEPQNAVSAGISALLESDGEELDEDFLQTLEVARRQRESLGAEIAGLQAASAAPSGGFDEYLREQAPRIAAALAGQAGVATQCEARGINELLRVKSVRMWTGAALALARERALDGRAPGADELGGAVHAVAAAASADALVTDSNPLRALASGVGVEGFTAIDLKSLLARTA